MGDGLSSRFPEIPILDGVEGIRATVIGASQYSIQMSGDTIFISDAAQLPVHNIPVIPVNLPSLLSEEGMAQAIVAA